MSAPWVNQCVAIIEAIDVLEALDFDLTTSTHSACSVLNCFGYVSWSNLASIGEIGNRSGQFEHSMVGSC